MLVTSNHYGVLMTENTENLVRVPQNSLLCGDFFFFFLAYEQYNFIKSLSRFTSPQVNALKEEGPEPENKAYMESKTFFFFLK